jgi:hypothetical protein
MHVRTTSVAIEHGVAPAGKHDGTPVAAGHALAVGHRAMPQASFRRYDFGGTGIPIQCVVGNSFEASIGTDVPLTLPITAISKKREYRAHVHRQQSFRFSPPAIYGLPRDRTGRPLETGSLSS